MVDISAALVKELREETNVGMMECKKALVEAGGDKAKAMKILRERGIAVAAKKSSRAANQGLVVSALAGGGKAGALVEINCETDFVAKNEGFKAFAAGIAERAAASRGDVAAEVKDLVTAKIAEIGENIVFRRSVRFELQGHGRVVSYIHHGATIGVLLECSCGKPETESSPVFQALLKDISMHVAAAFPKYLDPASVPAPVVAAEREIFAKQVQGKPANIIEKIVDGKMRKFYEQVCLVDQAFIKDQDQTVAALVKAKSAELGDEIAVKRFARYQVGEAI